MPLSDKRCGLCALATVAPGDTYQMVLAACRSRLLFTLPNSPLSILQPMRPARVARRLQRLYPAVPLFSLTRCAIILLCAYPAVLLFSLTRPTDQTYLQGYG